MIPQAYITEWANQVPWQTNEQVEQDLVICRALVEIFSDEFPAKSLAFRGGTVLHKLYLSPQPAGTSARHQQRSLVAMLSCLHGFCSG